VIDPQGTRQKSGRKLAIRPASAPLCPQLGESEMSESIKKKPARTFEGTFSSVEFDFDYDDVEKRERLRVTLCHKDGRRELISVGTRVSSSDGAVLMYATDGELNQF
jgi:hypothetical protein